MNGLYPIIRRKRRPLVAVDQPPTVAANVEPVKVETTPVRTETVGNGSSGALPELRAAEDND